MIKQRLNILHSHLKIELSQLNNNDNDKHAVFDLVQNDQVMAFLGPRRALTQLEAYEWFEQQFNHPYRFAIRLSHNQELIGFCGITHIDQKMDFSYFFRQQFWGNKFAKIACQLVIKHLKNVIDFNEVQVLIADQNTASLNIARNLNWEKIKPYQNDFETGWEFRIPSKTIT